MDIIKELKFAGTANYTAGALLGPRINESFLFVRINEGSVIWEAHGESHKISPGMILCSQPNTIEYWRWDKYQDTTHDFIHWDFSHIPPELPKADTWPLHDNFPRNGVLHTLFDHMLALRYSDNPQALHMQKLALVLMVHAYAHRSDARISNDPFHQAIQEVFHLIVKNWTQNSYKTPPIEEMCRVSGLSKPHLTRLFKKECGDSPVKFCEHLRLHCGAHSLINQRQSIEEISSWLGYETQFHFSRNFKKYYQVSPLAFRKSNTHHPEVLSNKSPQLLRAFFQIQHLKQFGLNSEFPQLL